MSQLTLTAGVSVLPLLLFGPRGLDGTTMLVRTFFSPQSLGHMLISSRDTVPDTHRNNFTSSVGIP